MNGLKLGVLLSVMLASTSLLADNPTSNIVNEADPSFQALSTLSTTEQQSLITMTSEQLAEIEGTLSFNFFNGTNCFGCNNIAIVIQNNISIGSGFGDLSNMVGIGQGIN